MRTLSVEPKDVGTLPALARNHSDDDRPNWPLLMAAFLASKRPNTRESYRYAVESFTAFVRENFGRGRDIPPGNVTPQMVTAWGHHLEASGNKPGTVGARLVGISAWYAYLMVPRSASRGGWVGHNPVTKEARSPWQVSAWGSSRCLSPRDFWRIIDGLEERGTLTALRDRSILLFLGLTGRRRREVMNLRGSNFEEGAGLVYYRYENTKSQLARRREVPEPALRAIEEYLRAAGRPALLDLGDAPVWICHSGRTVGQPFERIDWALKQAAKRAGVDPARVRVHALRHMNAAMRRESGQADHVISAALDHSSLAVTSTYLQAVVGDRDEGAGALWQALSKYQEAI